MGKKSPRQKTQLSPRKPRTQRRIDEMPAQADATWQGKDARPHVQAPPGSFDRLQERRGLRQSVPKHPWRRPHARRFLEPSHARPRWSRRPIMRLVEIRLRKLGGPIFGQRPSKELDDEGLELHYQLR